MKKLFPTQEIGSLAKPTWRTKAYRGERLSKKEIAEAISWGRRLGLENLTDLEDLLSEEDLPQRKQALLEWSSLFAIRLFEEAGLDIIFSGEQWRSEMYEHVAGNVSGFEFLGYVKSFDNRYFRKASCTSKPKFIRSLYGEEFRFAKTNTRRELKVPFTGPYTIIDWTFNEYYEKKSELEIKNLKQKRFEARKDFLFDLIKEVVRPEISELVSSGARWIQIDEPAATTNPTEEEMELFVDSFNESVKNFNCFFSLHNCYSDYEALAKHVCNLEGCGQLTLEFANRNGRGPAVADRKGYREIALFENKGFEGAYGLGVIDVHTDFIEPAELVKERVLHAANMIGDPDRIYVNPDCGLRTRTWETSLKKLQNMVLGARLARESL